MAVSAIWRYPVKAMLGQRLDAVRLTAAGLVGDRSLAVADARTGERIASKRGPTHPALRACRAELDDDDATLTVTLPDGARVAGADVDAALSDLLGRPVELVPYAGDGDGRLGTPAAHHDAAAVHLVTTRTLAHLRALDPGTDWDPRRLRPNLVLDDGHVPGAFTEDGLLGGELRSSGGARLRVLLPTPRCVVPTRATEELPARPALLRTLASHHRADLGPLGRPVTAGAYADVAAAGALVTGERLEATAPDRTLGEVVRDLAARLGA